MAGRPAGSAEAVTYTSGLMRFAPEYIRYVLNDNFEDAKKLLLSPMIAMHYAHLVMLADQGIVSREVNPFQMGVALRA